MDENLEDSLQRLEDQASLTGKISSVSFSKLFGSHWLLITLLLFCVSLFVHQVPLLLISLLFFVTGGVARLWDRHCLSRVEYRRRLSANRAFFGDEVQLEIEIANRKPLPLPWVQIEDEIPTDVTLLKGGTTPTLEPARSFLVNLLSNHRVIPTNPICPIPINPSDETPSLLIRRRNNT